jgi:uracil-DNA glycosylase, family 4
MKIINKAKVLADTRAEYEEVPVLQFLKNKAKQYVPGNGPFNASVAILGEAPGGTEDDLGQPFVGPAGRVLNKLLKENDVDRDSIWVTNIVKYRPPQNRPPTPEEIEASRPFLLRELSTLKIKNVIVLGRSAMSAMGIANPVVSQLHGTSKVREFDGREIRLFMTYHPAAALRDPTNMVTLREDFGAIFKEINRGS